MDKIFAFNNAQEFQHIFGITEHDNGVKSRRNKILLALYKSPSMWAYCRNKGYEKGYKKFFSITSMVELKDIIIFSVLRELERKAGRSCNRHYQVCLMGDCYWTEQFSTDENHGIPSNRDVGFVRYVSHEPKRNGKVYRMRAGKFYKRLLLETELGRALPEQVLNWMCEEFTNDWSSYVVRQLPHYELHVDDDFERIYTYGGKCCTEAFGSCMMDDEQHIFYQQSVKAKAAYLTNDNNKVIARCVIFTDVYDEEGNKWRLAERQYSECCRDLYKRCLVDSLIEGGYIDGYKQVGVDCHQTTSYVDKNGKSLSDKRFYIECDLGFSKNCDDAWENKNDNRILSYQDSFKFYKYKEKRAYNREPYDCSNVICLDTTNSYLEGFWDEYHQRYCACYTRVLVHGTTMRCDVDDVGDFIYFNEYYIHKDDFVPCPVCGEPMPDPKIYNGCGFMFSVGYNDKRKFVCSKTCREVVRKEFEKEFFYDQIEGRYVNKNEEKPILILHLYFGNVETLTCRASQFERYMKRGDIAVFDTERSNLPIPMFSRGLIDPEHRFRKYEITYPASFERITLQIAEENKANGVEQLYS